MKWIKSKKKQKADKISQEERKNLNRSIKFKQNKIKPQGLDDLYPSFKA